MKKHKIIEMLLIVANISLCAMIISASFNPKIITDGVAFALTKPDSVLTESSAEGTEHLEDSANAISAEQVLPSASILTEATERMSCGRLTIPRVRIDVALYNSCEQSIVDGINAAGYFEWNGAWLIADHCNQGFDAIMRCVPGDMCYIDNGSETEVYECIETGYGLNTEYDITEMDGSTSVCREYPGHIIMYTCRDSWKNISFAVWRRVDRT